MEDTYDPLYDLSKWQLRKIKTANIWLNRNTKMLHDPGCRQSFVTTPVSTVPAELLPLLWEREAWAEERKVFFCTHCLVEKKDV